MIHCSVTQRIEEIDQPLGGYLPIQFFAPVQLEDPEKEIADHTSQ